MIDAQKLAGSTWMRRLQVNIFSSLCTQAWLCWLELEFMINKATIVSFSAWYALKLSRVEIKLHKLSRVKIYMPFVCSYMV